MKILVINSGSSSVKYQFFNNKNEVIKKGYVERIGLPLAKCKNHAEAINQIIMSLPETPDAIGHRVVHGGNLYNKATKITTTVIKHIKELSSLAPLHNPHNLEGILICKKLLPKTPQVAVFDTAFHQTIPEIAHRYAIPKKYYEKNNIRRYGFHGTSHQYVVNEALKHMKTKKAKIISCHLGNGSSITATLNGKSIDTTMGFTPLEGIMMGTRSGSIDSGIIFHLHNKLKLKPEKIEQILQNESGLLGHSGISSDMRKIYAKYKKGNKAAIATIETLAYQIAKQIGAYAASLNGLDAIIFTGTLGQNAFYVRKIALEQLTYLGLKIDPNLNTKNSSAIHHKTSKIKAFVIPTNEELQIAKETRDTV
ncbi:acetate kinase [Candidatus Peregrinibacteria bacterium CG10_big_fil_rev_8_21_14_0_10_36_19]|nr:MAG: acetate kinase [Candidatus Peregrinibacteria bacterium CG10_big_fil_rev_8_21_14_0_10_36_19]